MAEAEDFEYSDDVFGAVVQYPDTNGRVRDWSAVSEKVHNAGGTMIVGSDLMALTLLTPPGEFGADISYGSTQRFGVPMGVSWHVDLELSYK